MARVRFFAQARDATGVRDAQLEGATVGEVLDAAVAAYGELAKVLPISAIWVNGDRAARSDPVRATDEVAVLPPVSGGGQ
jgi:molybdopterin synthase catalytic subunit